MYRAKSGGRLAALLAAGGLWAWQNRDRIRDLVASEQFQSALKSPQAQRIINSPTARSVLEHPQVQRVLNYPQVRSWLAGQQGQTIDQEPYTGETRRL